MFVTPLTAISHLVRTGLNPVLEYSACISVLGKRQKLLANITGTVFNEEWVTLV